MGGGPWTTELPPKFTGALARGGDLKGMSQRMPHEVLWLQPPGRRPSPRQVAMRPRTSMCSMPHKAPGKASPSLQATCRPSWTSAECLTCSTLPRLQA